MSKQESLNLVQDEDRLIKQKLDLLFSDQRSNNIHKFSKANSIIIRPNVIWDLFILFELSSEDRQIFIIQELSRIIEKIPHNIVPLLTKTKRKRPDEKTVNLVDELIKLAITLYSTKKYEVGLELMRLITILLKYNKLSVSNLNAIYSLNTVDFYDSKISEDKIFFSIKLLNGLFSNQTPLVNEPQNFFYFSGVNSGIQVVTQKTWPFIGGFSLCIWIYLEDVVGEADFPSKLFTIHSPTNPGGGGIEAYFLGRQLFYRSLSMNYSNPVQGSNGVLIGEFKPRMHHLLCLEHERASHGTTQLKIVINDEPLKKINMEFPKIDKSALVQRFTFGEGMTGRITSILVFNASLGKKLTDVFSYFHYGIQNNQDIKKLHIIFEKLMEKVYLMFLPIRSCEKKGMCYDIFKGNEGVFLENSGFTTKEYSKSRACYLGGLASIIPFFYLLGFCSSEKYPGLLNDLLRMVITLLKKRSENQAEAVKTNMFKMIGQHLGELQSNFVNSDTVELLAEIKNIIIDPRLSEQLFVDLLWKAEIFDKSDDISVKNEMWKFLRTIYIQNCTVSASLFGVQEILNLALQKFDAKNLLCCDIHGYLLGLLSKDQIKSEQPGNKVEKSAGPLINIIEAIILTGGENASTGLFSLLNSLTVKCSPCFLILIFKLLKAFSKKNLVIDRKDQISGGKTFAQIFHENNVMNSLLYLISTSPCLDVKAMAIKLINFMLRNKPDGPNEAEISGYLSAIIWNLNYSKSQDTPTVSPAGINVVQPPKTSAQANIRKASFMPDSPSKIESPETRGSRSKSENFVSQTALKPPFIMQIAEKLEEYEKNMELDEKNMELEGKEDVSKKEEPGTTQSTENLLTQNTEENMMSLQPSKKQGFKKKFVELDMDVVEEGEKKKEKEAQKPVKAESTKMETEELVLDMPPIRKNNPANNSKKPPGFSINFEPMKPAPSTMEEEPRSDFNLGTQFLNDDYETIPQAPSMINKRKPGGAKGVFQFSKGQNKQDSVQEPVQISAKESQPLVKAEENMLIQPKITKKGFQKKFEMLTLDSEDKPLEKQEEKLEEKKEDKQEALVEKLKPALEENLAKPAPTKPRMSKSKKFISQLLQIDTEDINKDYDYGGEKGKKTKIEDDDLNKEYLEICELARLCVQYMRGEVGEEEVFNMKMPKIPQRKFNAPQSVRGIKSIDLEVGKPKKTNHLEAPKDLNIIRETSFMTNEEMSLSNSMELNTIENLGLTDPLQSSQKGQSMINQGSGEKQHYNSSFDIDIIDSEPLYNSMMEWILNKIPSNLDSQLMIDDSDKVTNPHTVQLLMSFYKNATESLRSKMLQDIYMLVKWNQANCTVFLGIDEFHSWLLDLLLEEQITFFNQEVKGCHAAIWDAAVKVHNILMRHAFVNDSEGHKKVNNILNWLEIKSYLAISTDKEQTIAAGAKFLIRYLWNSLNETFSEVAISSRPFMNTNFWKNLVYFVHYTFEIVISAHNPLAKDLFKNNIREIYPSIKNYISISREGEKIPHNFKPFLVQHNWLDFKVLEGLFKLLDAMWPEALFNMHVSLHIEAEFDKYEKKISNLLDYRSSSEYLKDLEVQSSIFLAEPNLTSEIKRGPFIKIVNLLATLFFDNIIKYERWDLLPLWSDRLSRISRYFILVSENSRDKTLSQHTQTIIISNIIFLIHYLYLTYEKYLKKDEVKQSVKKILAEIGKFILLCMDFINIRHGVQSDDKQRPFESNLQLSGSLSNFNLILYEMFNNYLFDAKGDPILRLAMIKQFKINELHDIENLVLSDEWIYAFTDNHIVINLISNHYDDNYLKIVQDCYNQIAERKERHIVKEETLEKTRDINLRRFENEIYEHTVQCFEEQEIRKQGESILNENKLRLARKTWNNLWKKLRVFSLGWRHPNLKTQYDDVFTMKNFDFELMANSERRLFYFKTWKYEIKNKAKPFLKIKLVEPSIVNTFDKKHKNNLGNMLNLKQNQLLMSPTQPHTHPSPSVSPSVEMLRSSSNGKRTGSPLNIFTLGKNIKNSLRAIIPGSTKITPLINTKPEEIVLHKKCQWIKTLTIRNGTLSITNEKLIFYHDGIEQKESHISILTFKLPEHHCFNKEWDLTMIKEIYRRRHILRKTALEIFMLDGSSILLNFPDGDQEEVSQKLIRLRKTRCPNLIYHKTLDSKKLMEKSGVTKKWLNYEISNFEYLMYLNSVSGRSYRDITQYPVFPWILCNYNEEKINLEINECYRDLSKTMGNYGKEDRKQTFLERFEHTDPFNPVPRFHYGSHYSSPAIILHFLVRIHSFTEGAKELQSGKFDLADRLFFSVEESFKGATEEVSDVRELIPEFFFLPECLLNLEKQDFGIQQNGVRVHNVTLPKWARQNPYLFITLHRTALESETVSKSIHNWIDLIFGYKQTGKEAEKCLNKFFYMTYEDSVDFSKITDDNLRISTESQIIHFGQTPSQLFLKPHPARPGREALFFQVKWIADPTLDLRSYKPANKNKKPPNMEDDAGYNLKNVGPRAIFLTKFFGDSKLFIFRKEGTMTLLKWSNIPVQTNNPNVIIPFSCGIEKEKKLLYERLKNDYFTQVDMTLETLSHPVQILDQGKVVVVGGYWDGHISVLSTENDNKNENYEGHIETVCVLASDQKENFLISGSTCGEVILWKIMPEYKLQIKHQFYDHDDEITSIFISREMKAFATSSVDGKVNLYNIFNCVRLRTIYHPQKMPIHNVILSTSPLCVIIIYSENDMVINCYSVNGVLIERVQEEVRKMISPIIVSDVTSLEVLAYGNEKGEVLIRELPFLSLRKRISVTFNNTVMTIVATKDHRYLLCGCSDGEITVLTDPTFVKQSATFSNNSQN